MTLSTQTAWIPFGDIPIGQGVLIWSPGSHTDERYKGVRETYGNVDLGGDGTHSGWCVFVRIFLQLCDFSVRISNLKIYIFFEIVIT